MTSAVVFAYHNVGVRCLSVLLNHRVDVRMVLTHDDNPNETIWFDSVAALARKHRIETITPIDPNEATVVDRIRAAQPDFIFSFYYRSMLQPALLAIPRRGALNMHGSLLPKYRGRVPVNWAVIRGETETGATLHYMVEKPDAGDIVGQQSVPIGPDETAFDVFGKVTDAAAIVLDTALPSLLRGERSGRPQDLRQGSYFGGRKPEDGRIDWQRSATEIHNLVRGVAPPYPGAFFDLQGKRIKLIRTKPTSERRTDIGSTGIIVLRGSIHAVCGDGKLLELIDVEVAGERVDADRFYALFGVQSHAQKISFDPT
jgi:methionyl-tRNA formyltransferase